MPDDKSDPLSAPSSLKYGVLLPFVLSHGSDASVRRPPEPVDFGPLCVYFIHTALRGCPELGRERICAIYSGVTLILV